MVLNLNDDTTLQEPDEATVRAAIANLPPEQFAILCRKNEEYVQVYHNEDRTFQLEYRAGSYREHYAASSAAISTTDVQDAFVAYLSGRSDWYAPWEWEIVEFDEGFAGDLTFENAYLLNGEEFPKVPVACETPSVGEESGGCPCCKASPGEFHDAGCEREECPRCHEPLQQCDCE